MKRKNNHISKKSAKSILKSLFKPADVRRFEFLKVVILAGLPGCGKTTISQLLTTCYGFERFSTDMIRTKDLFKGQTHRMGSAHDEVMISRFLVYEELGRRVAKALSQQKRVVIDGTNMDDKRLTVLGAVLSQVVAEQVAFIALRPPEWIMKKRFINKSKEEYDKWWGVYKWWRKYMKNGDASFPTETNFPRIRQIQVRRYATRTFEWVPEIKGVIWDMDKTLYKNVPKMSDWVDDQKYLAVMKATGMSKTKAKKAFWDKYKKIASNTKTLDTFGVDGKKFFIDVCAQIDYTEFLKPDKRLIATIKSLSHLKHFIMSNAEVSETKRKMKALGLKDSMFGGVLGCYESPYLKPDPKVFLWAAKKMKLKPEQILNVGDMEATDIVPSKKAGMKACFVWGASREADVSVPTIYEVAELFGKEI